MSAAQIRPQHFAGSANVHSTSADGLTAVARGLAQDNARSVLASATIGDFIDNTTGVAAAVVPALALPAAAFDGSAGGASPAAAFNTAMDVLENVGAVFGDRLNRARAILGLPLVSWAAGTIVTAGTLPAMTKALAATSGATAIDFTTGRAAMRTARRHIATLARAMNEVLEAAGDANIVDNSGGSWPTSLALPAIPAATAGTGAPAGSTSISDAAMDTFLDGLANAVASLARHWNLVMVQTGLADLIDNSGGTAAGNAIAAINQAFTAHQDGGTDSAPFADLNVELPKIENNFADLAARTNALLAARGLPLLTDNTGGTANATLEVIDDTLTAVDGTATDTASKASADVTFGQIANNFATLAVKINVLAPLFGLTPLVDSSGGTAGAALVALTDTVGVNNSAAATGVSDAQMDAALDVVTDNFATMAAKLNEMTGSTVEPAGRPLRVVAGL